MRIRLGLAGAAVVSAVVAAGCGGGSGSGADGAADTTPADLLSIASTCEEWQSSDAADQRSFAETRDSSAVAFIETVNNACTPGRKALTLGEAVRIETAPPPDPFAQTRVKAAFRGEIAREILKSWNRCGSNDVCISGEQGDNVECNQPDPQVRVLACFVVTAKGANGESSFGYPVKTTVSADGSYTWRIDR